MDAQFGANLTGFTSLPIDTDFSILEETRSESQYVTASTPEIPGDVEQKEQGEDHLNSPGYLPEYKTIHKPSMINWGKRSDGNAFVISTSVITDSYIQITTWSKNVFLVPYGKVGRDFIDQVTLHINDWNSGSDNQHISRKQLLCSSL